MEPSRSPTSRRGSVYSIVFSRSALKALDAIPQADRRRIVAQVERLAENPRPRGSKKLEGAGAAMRVRIGPYRVIYDVEDATLRVLVLKIAPRKDAYR